MKHLGGVTTAIVSSVRVSLSRMRQLVTYLSSHCTIVWRKGVCYQQCGGVIIPVLQNWHVGYGC